MKQTLFDWVLRIKKWSKWLLIGAGTMYFLLALDQFTATDRSTRCPSEEHDFNGQKFDVEFCLWGGGDYHQYMHLRVFSKSGELLAARGSTFKRADKMATLDYFAIEDDLIRYSDDTGDNTTLNVPEDCVLHMPPTKTDWLEARLPGGIPGINHCAKVSDEISEKARHSWFLRLETERIKRGEIPHWPDHPEVKKIHEDWAAQQEAQPKKSESLTLRVGPVPPVAE